MFLYRIQTSAAKRKFLIYIYACTMVQILQRLQVRSLGANLFDICSVGVKFYTYIGARKTFGYMLAHINFVTYIWREQGGKCCEYIYIYIYNGTLWARKCVVYTGARCKCENDFLDIWRTHTVKCLPQSSAQKTYQNLTPMGDGRHLAFFFILVLLRKYT